MSNENNLFKGEVTSLAFGGQGIIRENGLVVFIPFTAPGDVVLYRIKQKKKRYALGEIVEIQHKSPDRSVPLCRYFGRCGGCQLQHLAYSTQLEYKRQSVEDALKHIGSLKVEQVNQVIPASQQSAYRRHVQLSLRPYGNVFECGYIEIDNTTLLPVSQCPIFSESENPIFHQVQELVGKLSSAGNKEGKITILKEKESYLFQLHFKNLPSNCHEVIDLALKRHSKWQGILVNAVSKTITKGNPFANFAVDTLNFRFSPRVFIQNHPEQSLNIYREVCKIVQQSEAKNILDLYCGIGISSLLIAQQEKGCKVLGVEYNKDATQLATENARHNEISNVRFVQGDVKVYIKEKKLKNNFVIVNPPREGLDIAVVQELVKGAPAEILYISCMPSTLARDLKLLCDGGGYQVLKVQPYDMFPQTAHVETLVHLKK